MLNSVKLHSDYGQREKRKLRRKARQAVPEVATTAPATGGGRKPFVAVVPDEVAGRMYPRRRASAYRMAALCAEDLGIDPPTVRLLIEISPAQAGHLVQTGAGVELRRIDTAATGYAGDFVRVVVNRHAEDVACTAAHETRHIAQDKGTRSDYDTAENDADTYAEEAMQRLWPAVKEELPERAAPESIPSTTYQTR